MLVRHRSRVWQAESGVGMSTEPQLHHRLEEALARSEFEVAALVEDARAEACQEVQAMLRQLMVRDLLERSLRAIEPSGAAGTAGGQQPVIEAGNGDSAAVTYVYGFTSTDVPLPDGLPQLPGGGPVRSVDHGELRAVVCALDRRLLDAVQAPGIESMEALTATAQGHDATLSTLAQDRSVVPLRLGTVVAGESAVRDLLERHADALLAELRQVDGHAEWAVKVHPLEPRTYEEPAAIPGSSGRDYLAQRRASLRSRQGGSDEHQPTGDEIHHRLAAYAAKADLVANRPLDNLPPPLLHSVYLLDRDESERFGAAVADLQNRHPSVRIEISGPWPAYHFTSVRVTSDEGAST